MILSHDQIYSIFQRTMGRPISTREILERLGVPRIQQRLVGQMLNDLAADGKIVRLRKGYFTSAESALLVQGVIHVSERGTGFIIGGSTDGEDLYIHKSNRGSAMDGDVVEAEVVIGIRGEPEGRVIKIIKRAHEKIVGQFVRTGSGGIISPRNQRLKKLLIVIPKAPPKKQLPDETWVLVQVKNWPTDPEDPLIAEIIEVLGQTGEQGIPIMLLLKDMGVPLEFPPEVLTETAALEAPATSEELARRLDLRKDRIFTIDPITAKDFDDAISIKKMGNGHWWLGVHIADVSHYVRPGMALEEDALRRATSIYPVDRVVPMLPERISNDLCSLRPEEDRYAMSCFMEINGDGLVVRYEIAESVIRSCQRLNYDEVQAFFDRIEKRSEFRFADLGNDLLESRELARVLTKMRMQRGALDLDMPETFVDCDEEGKPVNVRRYPRYESHRLIEECMLIANETVAVHLKKMKLPALYRIHDIPDPSALQKITPALALFGIKVPKKLEPTPEFYQPIVNRLLKVDGGHIGQRLLLQTLMRAVYSKENRGHFGLASTCYCHFTSPIRRYPDLFVHRMLKAWLRGESDQEEWQQFFEDNLDGWANQCNRMSENADGIEKEAVRIKSIEFMANHLGEVFEGWISGIARRGFFVELIKIPSEGFVTASSIPGDVFMPDEDMIRMVGRHTRRKFQLAERVRVRVIRVRPIDGEMDLELEEVGTLHGKKGKKAKKRNKEKNWDFHIEKE